MTTGKLLAFIDEGIVGAAALAFLLIVVIPLSPFILIGWLFSRLIERLTA